MQIKRNKEARYENVENLAKSTLERMTELGFDNGQYKLFLIELEKEYCNAKISY